MSFFERLFGKKGVPARATPVPPPVIEDEPFDPAVLEPLRKAAVWLQHSEQVGFSKLGGLPEVPEDFEWPHWKDKPLAFLGQFDLSTLPQVSQDLGPLTLGFLYFFYDQEQSTWGFDPADQNSWRVIYSQADRNQLRPASAPEGLETIYPEQRVRYEPIRLYPSGASDAVSELDLSSDEMDEMDTLNDDLFTGGSMHYFFGLPQPVQNDDMESECQYASNGVYVGGGKVETTESLDAGILDWKLLLQLDSDDDVDFCWGDLGRLYFWIRRQDWEARDFSKVWMVLQCS